MTSTLSMSGVMPVGGLNESSYAPAVAWSAPVLESTVKGAAVLIASDDSLLRNSLQQHLSAAGYEVEGSADAADVARRAAGRKLIVLLDLQMLKGDDLDALKTIRQSNRYAQIVVMAGAEEAKKATEALRLGAYELLNKPFQSAELLAVLRQAAKTARMFRDYQELRAALVAPRTVAEFPAVSAKSQAVVREVDRLAKADATVLITGESGTGKSVVARLIHQRSNRSQGPFVVVNCAALPQELLEEELFGTTRDRVRGTSLERAGRIEMADGGTLVLHEIANCPLEVQTRLLGLLQNRTVQRIGSTDAQRVDVRMVLTSRRSLSSACQEGRLREDLLQRLSPQVIEMPAMRERLEDLPQLVESIRQRLIQARGGRPLTIGSDCLQLLKQHNWTGNVRELECVLERAFLNSPGDALEANTLKMILADSTKVTQSAAQSGISMLAGRTLDDIEKQAIIETLQAYRGNKARSARILGISEKSIYNKMRRLGIPFDLVGSA
jgi:DNA-binding NtrC family response regulator